MVEVTQEDRDAVADTLKDMFYDTLTRLRVREGRRDNLAIVQGFARHRQAGVQQGLDMAKTAVGALKSGSTGDRNEPVHAAFLSTCIIAVATISKLGGDDVPS